MEHVVIKYRINLNIKNMKSFSFYHNKITLRNDIKALVVIIFILIAGYFLLFIFGYFETDEELSQKI